MNLDVLNTMQTPKKSYLIYFIFCLTLICGQTSYSQNNSQFVVVLDAGHGGKDPGRPTKHGYKEKDIALKIALAVGKQLEANSDIKVIYTRTKDVFLELHERAAIANKADADLFVSIHCNAHHTQAYGTETYVLALRASKKNFEIAKKENEVIFLEDNYEMHYEGFDPNSPESVMATTILLEEYLDQSIMLASYIQNNFTNTLKRKNRGVKQAGFWVLHNTYMPSVLIETGFITNKSEGDYLNSKKGQAQISSEIANAIKKYKTDIFLGYGEIVTVPPLDDTPQEENIIPNVVFKVQIAASSNKLEPKPYNFKGLSDVSREKINGLYKYYYGYTSDYNKIKSMAEQAKTSGYDSAFVVAFKDGEQITIDQALKTTVN